ncbi:hypothetical protein XELAEV_18041338mg [Xenopus laevis]|uniref:Uncharacterized protein n=1 Tax=Xenopus laevis TaxID=8355 RepID=A0A974C290_XENLA|nr:hypothetical protein XELAEV_18041338mg [Xenopus laevis]
MELEHTTLVNDSDIYFHGKNILCSFCIKYYIYYMYLVKQALLPISHHLYTVLQNVLSFNMLTAGIIHTVCTFILIKACTTRS